MSLCGYFVLCWEIWVRHRRAEYHRRFVQKYVLNKITFKGLNYYCAALLVCDIAVSLRVDVS